MINNEFYEKHGRPKFIRCLQLVFVKSNYIKEILEIVKPVFGFYRVIIKPKDDDITYIIQII